MSKNQQPGTSRGGARHPGGPSAGAARPDAADQVQMSLGGTASAKAASQALTQSRQAQGGQPGDLGYGFSMAAADVTSPFAQSHHIGASNDLTGVLPHQNIGPHHPMVVSAGIPSPISIIPSPAPGGLTSSSASAFTPQPLQLQQIIGAGEPQLGAAASHQQLLTSPAQDMDQLCKELESFASQADAEGVQQVLEQMRPSSENRLYKKSLNVALRSAVQGCTTALLDEANQCVNQLIQAGANIDAEEANEGKTALMMACEKGYLEMVSNLLDQNALIYLKDQKKRTPLMYAIDTKAQNQDVVQELINRGADVNEASLRGDTPLLIAAMRGHSQIVKLLARSGADIMTQCVPRQNSALHFACLNGRLHTVQSLLSYCQKELAPERTRDFLYLKNRDGKTAQDLAREQAGVGGDGDGADSAARSKVQIFKGEQTRQGPGSGGKASFAFKIHEELEKFYSARQKEIDDVVQTLLEKEEGAGAHPKGSASAPQCQAPGQHAKQKQRAGSKAAANASQQQQQQQQLQGASLRKGSVAGGSTESDNPGKQPLVVLPTAAGAPTAASPSEESKDVAATAPVDDPSQPKQQTSKSKKKKRNQTDTPAQKPAQTTQCQQPAASQLGTGPTPQAVAPGQSSPRASTAMATAAASNSDDEYKSADSKSPPQSEKKQSAVACDPNAASAPQTCEQTKKQKKDKQSQKTATKATPAPATSQKPSSKGAGQASASGVQPGLKKVKSHLLAGEVAMRPGPPQQSTFVVAAEDGWQSKAKAKKQKQGGQAQAQASTTARKQQESAAEALDKSKCCKSEGAEGEALEEPIGERRAIYVEESSHQGMRELARLLQRQRAATRGGDPPGGRDQGKGERPAAAAAAARREIDESEGQSSGSSSCGLGVGWLASVEQGMSGAPLDVWAEEEAARLVSPSLLALQELTQLTPCVYDVVGAEREDHGAPEASANANDNQDKDASAPRESEQAESAAKPAPATSPNSQQQQQSWPQVFINQANQSAALAQQSRTTDSADTKDPSPMDPSSEAPAASQPTAAQTPAQPGGPSTARPHADQQATEDTEAPSVQQPKAATPFKLQQQPPPGVGPMPMKGPIAMGPGQQFTTQAVAMQAPGGYLGTVPPQMVGQAPFVPIQMSVNLPVHFVKNLDSEKAQMDFMLEQQEQRAQALSLSLHQHKERIHQMEHEQKCKKQEHVNQIKEYYGQATRYYENFRQLEGEMYELADKNEEDIREGLGVLAQLKAQMGDDGSQALLDRVEAKLRSMDDRNKKFSDEIDYRKEDEKTYLKAQEQKRISFERTSQESRDLHQQMHATPGTGHSKQQMARTQALYGNLLIDMENAYARETADTAEPSLYYQQVFNKLNDEIILFEEGVKSIMDEIEPVKKIICDKISGFIQQLIPQGEVLVYGSHATKLCLHWSDIDLVLKPRSTFEAGRDFQGGSSDFGASTSSQPFTPMGSSTRNWLSLLSSELMKQEHRQWIKKVEFIENTSVPVIKLACSYQHLSQNVTGQLLLPNSKVPRYPNIVSKPINIDITLWTESHNGPPCVDLVKSYLAESQLIEPLILVLKSMLKEWGFNDAYTGGLSSYALFLMIVSFLQEKKKPTSRAEVNLGETLLDFLRFYAQLDINQYAICCRMPGETTEKANIYQNNQSEFNLFQAKIVIDDPLLATNNVGKSAFRIQEIKNIMGNAYNSAFTGCFCSSHFASLCRNTNLQHNPGFTHKSQLASHFGTAAQPFSQGTAYPNYQHPPTNFSQEQSHAGAQGSLAQYPQDAMAANRAPFPAAASVQQRPSALHTRSQPFILNKKSSSAAYGGFTGGDGEGQHWGDPSETDLSTCDSVLARLIYGYKKTQKTMESLQQRYHIQNPFLFGSARNSYLEHPQMNLMGPFQNLYM